MNEEKMITKYTGAVNWATWTNRSVVDGIIRSLDVSEATLKDYRWRIDAYVRHTGKNGLSWDTFVEFKRGLSAREDLSVASKNKYLSAARMFTKELNRRGVIPVDITQNVKAFKQTSGHKVMGLDEDEIKAAIEKISGLPKTARNDRLKAIFTLLVLQGLRQIEVVRLDVDDLDLKRGAAFIRGKGRDEKELIYLAPETVKALEAYLASSGLKEGALFRSMGNRRSERLTTMTVYREIKSLFRLAEVDKSARPHGLRHYFITALLKSFDVRDVRKFSRHKTLETIILYDDELDVRDKAQIAFGCLPKIGV